MKRFFSFFVVIFFVLSLFAVSAAEISFSDAKMNFSKVYSENYVEGYSEIRNGIVRADFVTELLAKAYASVTDLEEAEVILKELKIYKMDTSEYFEGIPWSELKNLPVYMNEPDVFYDSVTDEWLIVGSGYWQNDEEWKKDESFNLFSNVQNIGYNDVVGFLLYDSENGKHYSVRDTLTCITNGENAKYYENINNHLDDSSVYIEFCDSVHHHVFCIIF